MEFKTANEIIIKKAQKLNRKKDYEQLLKDAKMHLNKRSKRSKEYWEPIIEDCKIIIKEFEKEISSINNYIEALINFPREIIFPFILECINLYEDEKYTYTIVPLSLTNHATTNGLIPVYQDFEIIFPESLLEEEKKLETSFYISVLQPAYRELFNKNNAKYIMVPSNGYLPIISTDFELYTYFNEFPYLKEIAINLIDRKLKEPLKKNLDILLDELNELKEKQKTKSKG